SPEWGVCIDAEVSAGYVRYRLRTAAERLKGVKDANSQAALPGKGFEGPAILRAAQMDGRLSRRRAQGVRHIGRQGQDDVVRHGENRQIRDVDCGGRGLTRSSAELGGQVSDVIRIPAADRANGVA